MPGTPNNKLFMIFESLIFVSPNIEKMKAFFEAIAYIFQEVLFIPLNFFRELELTSWLLANGINWVFLGIGFAATTYWILQLKKFNDSGEEDTDSTSHSFL